VVKQGCEKEVRVSKVTSQKIIYYEDFVQLNFDDAWRGE
jgi:hypothetical protein